jgi:hypothetical protein
MSIMLIESEGKPTARSFVGAAGLMQVMPFWAGRWRGCGKDLYDIETNLCNGTSILAWYFRNFDGVTAACAAPTHRAATRIRTRSRDCAIVCAKNWRRRDRLVLRNQPTRSIEKPGVVRRAFFRSHLFTQKVTDTSRPGNLTGAPPIYEGAC